MARNGGIDTQYFDSNGDPLSGGKLYFYDTGTSNDKTTYSDSDMTSANAQPLVLDANGVPGDVFFTGDAKIVLKDSADVTIRTMDPVTGGVSGEWTFVLPPKTADFQAESGSYYFADTSSAAVEVTFPLSPSAGDRLGLAIATGEGSNSLTWDLNGEKFEGASPGSPALQDGQSIVTVQLIYINATIGWITYAYAARLAFIV